MRLDWSQAFALANTIVDGMAAVRAAEWSSLRGCGWNGGRWPAPARSET